MAPAEIEREFAILSVDAGAAGERQLNTRAVGTAGILIGLDPGGTKHLLAPTDTSFAEDFHSQGVHLRRRTLLGGGRPQQFADMVCVAPELDMVFDRLAQDVVDHAEDSPAAPITSFRHVLAQWRELLRKTEGTSTDAAVGLVGELHLLQILAQSDPLGAFDSWTGPRRTVHDYVRGDHALEVKTTASLEGTTVSIHGLDQLDPIDVEGLHLVVIHCRPMESAPSLDDRIDELTQLGIPKTPLVKAVAQAGYIYEARLPLSTRFKVLSTRVWQVGPDFPGLRRSSLPEAHRRGVSRVQYTLSTDSAPDPLTDDETQELFGTWLSR